MVSVLGRAGLSCVGLQSSFPLSQERGLPCGITLTVGGLRSRGRLELGSHDWAIDFWVGWRGFVPFWVRRKGRNRTREVERELE